jgi:O-antigen ligase
MNVTSKVFLIKKDAVNALPVAALITVLFPVLVTNILTILLYLFITIFILFGNTKIIMTRDLLKTALIMLFGMLIMAYSYDKEPVINFLKWSPHKQSALLTSVFLTSVIGFLVFLYGYFYSFIVKSPLKILRYVFLYVWALLGIYFIAAHGFFHTASLMLGIITIILLPYISLVFNGNSKFIYIFASVVLLYLTLISCRTAFVAAFIFFLTYYLYPYFIVNKTRYRLVFLFFIVFISLLIAIFMLSGFDFLSDISAKYFGGKHFKQGRDLIWPELFRYIVDKPLFGYGINQSSDYLQSTEAIMGYRNLSSHNIYFELLLSGGILLLSLFVFIFYKIWELFYSLNNNKMSRLAASSFLAFLFLGAGLPVGLIGNIVLNSLLWFYWGVASGNTWIKNNQNIVPA